jgi:hypothetical protein
MSCNTFKKGLKGDSIPILLPLTAFFAAGAFFLFLAELGATEDRKPRAFLRSPFCKGK